MSVKILFLCLCLLANVRPVAAQKNKALKLMEQARQAYALADSPRAIEYAEKAILEDASRSEPHIFLGGIYYKGGDYPQAAGHFRQAFALEPQPQTALRLADSYYHSNRFEESLPYFDYYLEKTPSAAAGQTREKILRRKENARFAAQSARESLPIKFENLGPGVNTSLNEYDPLVSADSRTLIFTRLDTRGGIANENLYQSTFTNGSWDKAVPLSGKLNTDDNEGSAALSPDEKTLIFTACNRRDSHGGCDLYISFREQNGWSVPRNMDAPINSRFWEGHPSIAADGRTIYFSSNRPGGKGGKDIWFSTLNPDGKWSVPRPLEQINSSGDETSPFIHLDNKTLYFSSDGWDSVGGKDYLISRRKDSRSPWTRPENLGYPINTPGEEFSIKVDRNGQTAYFSSDSRPRTYGGADMFRFELPASKAAQRMALLRGRVTRPDGGILPDARFQIYEISTSDTVSTLSYHRGEYSALLEVGCLYGVFALAKGYMPYSDNLLFEVDEKSDVLEKNTVLSPIRPGEKTILKNIYFDTGKSLLREESRRELSLVQTFLSLNPRLKVEISGHTDNTGADAYNLELSSRRAESVRNYLIKEGIAANRLLFRGYGKDDPVAPNDTEAGRALNRRTELKILEVP